MTELDWVFKVMIAGGIAWIIRGVSTINGSIKALNVWKGEHIRQDDERHKDLKDEGKDQWTAINDLRKGEK